MTEIRSYRDLEVWQCAMEMVEVVYGLVRLLPSSERYGLVSQLTRAAVSVPSNIAEGHGRGTRKDYAHFVSIARGSLKEVETLILIIVRLGFVEQRDADPTLALTDRIGQMLTKLYTRLSREPVPGSR